VAGSRGRWGLFNRTVNEVMRPVLRSPLHPLLSKRVALITVTGRKSGRQFTIPVGYRQAGNTIQIEVGWPEQKLWWRNLRGEGAPVRVRIRGREHAGHAVAHGDERTGVTVEVDLRPDGPA
jgi:hypothetical protein